jgi:hypothetical protein
MTEPSHKLSLIDLPLPARLVLATFLITVGIGYLSALVQLRVQHASAGQAMPGPEEVRRTFYGETDKSQLERLLTAPMSEPFNGSGSMVGAFLDPENTNAWFRDVNSLLKADKKLTPDAAEEMIRQRRNGERLALVEWIREGADEKSYTGDNYQLSDELAAQLKLPSDNPLVTERFIRPKANDKPAVKIQYIIQIRCVRCHKTTAGGAASEFPLDSYDNLANYVTPQKSGGMSLPKLAQSTHVHMLGFAVLWCLTGLIFACTNLPGWARAVFGPWTLIAQVADIACWWLAGQDPNFADIILITGALVGMGLVVQILGSCLCLFRKGGRLVMILVLILVAAGVAGFYLKVVEPRLKNGHSLTASLFQRDASGRFV